MEKLINQVKKENKKELKRAISNLNKAKKEDFTNLWYYSEKLTKRQKEKLTKSEQKEILKNQIIKDYEKELAKDLKRINTIKNANDNIESITINVEWVKNPTWGYNPHVTVYTNNGNTTEGKASGCGYDKQSAGIAEALNKNNDILKLLYTYKNKKMTLKNTNNHNLLGYGSGYGVLPYFEGGVGVPSLLNIFKKLGYIITEHHTDKSDFYQITKNKKGSK